MSRIGKFTVAATLLLPLGLGGCGPKKGTASPEDYFPLIQVALAGGETGAMIARNEFIAQKNWGGCVAGEALISAFDAGNQILSGKLQDKIVIPAVDIDVSECLALRDAGAEETEAGDENASYPTVVVATMVCGYAPPSDGTPEESAPVDEADKPAEGDSTAAAEGDKPAEEAPAEEAPAEEAPAEEAAADEDTEEAADGVEAALKGNPDVAALVETVAGITLVAVLHYATKLKTANCKKGTAALGAINYINGMIKPISDEIAEPDGKVSVPATTIDLSECADG